MWRMSVALTLIFRIEPNRELLRLAPKLPGAVVEAAEEDRGMPKSMR